MDESSQMVVCMSFDKLFRNIALLSVSVLKTYKTNERADEGKRNEISSKKSFLELTERQDKHVQRAGLKISESGSRLSEVRRRRRSLWPGLAVERVGGDRFV